MIKRAIIYTLNSTLYIYTLKITIFKIKSISQKEEIIFKHDKKNKIVTIRY